VRGKKPLLEFPPCLLHVLNICERHAFDSVPDQVERFYRNIYSYFGQSLQKDQRIYYSSEET